MESSQAPNLLSLTGGSGPFSFEIPAMFTNGEIVDLISKKFSIQGINFKYPTLLMICFLVDRILKTNETLPTRYKKIPSLHSYPSNPQRLF